MHSAACIQMTALNRNAVTARNPRVATLRAFQPRAERTAVAELVQYICNSQICKGIVKVFAEMGTVLLIESSGTVKASKYDYPAPPSIEGQLGEKYAVIEVGGLQQIVEEGHWYTCNRLEAPAGSTVNFPRVLAVRDGEKFEVGQPFLDNVTVQAEILEDVRGPKVVVVKYKRKKHYRRKIGHRQELTKFKITTIS